MYVGMSLLLQYTHKARSDAFMHMCKCNDWMFNFCPVLSASWANFKYSYYPGNAVIHCSRAFFSVSFHSYFSLLHLFFVSLHGMTFVFVIECLSSCWCFNICFISTQILQCFLSRHTIFRCEYKCIIMRVCSWYIPCLVWKILTLFSSKSRLQWPKIVIRRFLQSVWIHYTQRMKSKLTQKTSL